MQICKKQHSNKLINKKIRVNKKNALKIIKWYMTFFTGIV